MRTAGLLPGFRVASRIRWMESRLDPSDETDPGRPESRRPSSLALRARPAWALLLALGLLGGGAGCVSNDRPRFDYEPEEFRSVLRERIPDLPEPLVKVPFVVPESLVKRARRTIARRPLGPARVEALVDTLMKQEPDGIGLIYDWRASATADQTLELGRGNCLSLASVLVGAGRGLGWPVYYAEARTTVPQTEEMGDIRVVIDHIVVVITAQTVRRVVDFTGLVDEGYQLKVIDDLTAYAHLINNIAAERILAAGPEAGEPDWRAAAEGFRLAIRIQPELARAWNNLGLALSRLGEVDAAREAYARAVELDDTFGAAGGNLAILETRAKGGPHLIEKRP